MNAVLVITNLTTAANRPVEALQAPTLLHNSITANLAQRTNWTKPSVTLGATRARLWRWITCNYDMTNQYSIGENNILPGGRKSAKFQNGLARCRIGPIINGLNLMDSGGNS